MNIEAVLDSDLGSIVAPAGCGKTHLITEALSIRAQKPILVLTHTTAGVSALKKRLRRLSVPTSYYVVTTIDGWALRIANSFPASCPISASPDNPRQFYPELRRSVLSSLNSGGLHEIIKASYSRLLVDEYQDCDNNQHNIIASLSQVLPTVVFGDPMQCIFSFAGPMPDWQQEVQQRFPLLGTLGTPWRWNNAGAPDLGEWILDARETLLRRESLDLTDCPNHVLWRPLTGNAQTDLINQHNAQQRIINQNQTDSFLVIGSSMNERSRHRYAQSSRTTQVVEQVQLAQVITAASEFDRLNGINLVESILTTASTMATNVEMARTLTRVKSILGGRNRQPPTTFEQALSNVASSNERSDILTALQEVESKNGTRIYRRSAYTALKDLVSLSVSSPDKTMSESAMIIREQIRQKGDTRIPKRAIGSTLLLKGLEADHCLILDANERGMDNKHLYVALSRGAKTVTVFSRNNQIS
ncbi:hypothetical protein CGH81_10620 [Vibrio parahaemolyticus]|uniref:UvrD-helicase domain-containing protein n=1 Tax=Vibrio parahaemolyticus TaxID=670 RepID=UPI001123BA35|nr:UvrD-helicase domain-containing protein [Vibrio parahaemolyticus]TOM27263.1 hypothetical protein CGH81_10620 [Vibrio parahaemolyticus]HCG7064333.1 UvrD-helicase domain-containing protein [Vibrio parahaemolyticus]HCH2794530.1 UvrD-helicase domain-containing protein [Vibrio parahaemolyticus]